MTLPSHRPPIPDYVVGDYVVVGIHTANGQLRTDRGRIGFARWRTMPPCWEYTVEWPDGDSAITTARNLTLAANQED